ncbi:ABC transporter ATP-binding protein [Nocardioides sp. YR527]|uniref:ABC transporter ATP-binding protein n=1 Tax=Nocardioides sp. YR527 TaxID=1881028 RepID=UPI000B85A1AE|nr:ABC transporter ATP-binding protein [Nocardioides sp. YR527]
MIERYTEPPVLVAGNSVTRSFPNGTTALAEASFEIRAGEFVSFVGPSGCGKSTMLRMVAGLDMPTSGSVERGDGEVGYVFQDATLLPWRTALGNVVLPLRLAGTKRAEAEERARAALEVVGLAAYADHRPAQLSGGMRMRVSIARSLVQRPELFLFDEPFGALDEITRQDLNGQLDTLMATDPFTGIFVTHSVPEAVFLSDRVLVFSSQPGRIVADLRIDLPRPRPEGLRFSSEYAELCRQVSDALSDAHQKKEAAA